MILKTWKLTNLEMEVTWQDKESNGLSCYALTNDPQTIQSIITHWFRMSSERNPKEVIKKGCFLGAVCHIAIYKQHSTPKSVPVSTKHQMELLEKKVQWAFNWMWCVISRLNYYALPCISLGLCFVWFLDLPMDINVAALPEESPERED